MSIGRVARERDRARQAEWRRTAEVEKQTIAKAAGRYLESRCGVESGVDMPATAQRIHNGRKHYVCGLQRGHAGLHRWPADPITLLAEWS